MKRPISPIAPPSLSESSVSCKRMKRRSSFSDTAAWTLLSLAAESKVQASQDCDQESHDDAEEERNTGTPSLACDDDTDDSFRNCRDCHKCTIPYRSYQLECFTTPELNWRQVCKPLPSPPRLPRLIQ